MKKIATLSAGLVTMLLSTQALADTQNARFEPELEQRVAEFPWESGNIPDSGPIRINLGATARQDVGITLPGAASYDWDEQTLSFSGDEQAGQFTNVVGADITATVSVDVFGLEAEVDVGLWGIEETIMGRFTPYLMEGTEPLEMADSIGPYELVATPFDIAGATGMLYIDWRLDVPAVSYYGTHIDVAAEQGSQNSVLATVSREDEAVPMVLMDAEPGSMESVYGTHYGMLDSEISLHLLPRVEVTISGITYDIGPFDVAVDYPLAENMEMVFEDVEMEFEVPEAEPEPAPDPEDDDEPEDEDPEPEDDDEDPEDDEEPEGDTDGPMLPADDFGGASADGCGCTSGTTDPAHVMFGLFALAGIAAGRRRKRTTA